MSKRFSARASTRLTLYVLIAILTSLLTDLRSYDSWAAITSYKAFVGFLSAFVQALVTVRAFLDQSLTAYGSDQNV